MVAKDFIVGWLFISLGAKKRTKEEAFIICFFLRICSQARVEITQD